MISQYAMRCKCRCLVCVCRLLGSRPRLRRLLFLPLASLHCLPLCPHFRSLGNDVAPGLEAIDLFLVLKSQSIELVGTWSVAMENDSGSARLLLTWKDIDVCSHLTFWAWGDSLKKLVRAWSLRLGLAVRPRSDPILIVGLAVVQSCCTKI